MRARERQAWIGKVISREGRVSVDQLAQKLDVSVETIRRDLGKLDETGVVKKIHGGATRLELYREGSFIERVSENALAKREIAGKLVDVIEDKTTVFIDTGSTTLACAEVLAVTKTLTIITNSLRIAETFGATGRHRIFLLGGQYSSDNSETIGPMTLRQIADFHADVALISPAAIDPIGGIMDADFDEATVARVMIEQAEKLVIAADHMKFEKRAAHLVARLADIDILVSNHMPGEALRQRLETEKVIIKT